MRFKRSRRSAAELEKALRILQQLCAWGFNLGEDAQIADLDWELEPCPVDIALGTEVGAVWNNGPTNLIYALPIVLTARQRVTLVDVIIVSPWDACSIGIVVPKFDKHCTFHRYGPASYRQADILNNRFLKPFTLSRGHLCEGVILAEGCVPVPAEFTARNVPLNVTVVDTLERVAQAEVTLPLRSVQGGQVLTSERIAAHQGSASRDYHSVQPGDLQSGAPQANLPPLDGTLICDPCRLLSDGLERRRNREPE